MFHSYLVNLEPLSWHLHHVLRVEILIRELQCQRITHHSECIIHKHWLYFMIFPYSLCGYPDPIEVVKLYHDWRKSMFPSRVVKKICTCSFSATKKFYLDAVLFKSEWTVGCSWFLIPVQIESREQAIENWVKVWVSRDRKQKIHPQLISR